MEEDAVAKDGELALTIAGADGGSLPSSGITAVALNITVTSYNGSIDFGLTGCRRSVPHLQRMLTQLDEGLAELQSAVR